MSLDEKFWETAFTIHVPENETQKTVTTENTSKTTSGNFVCHYLLNKERGSLCIWLRAVPELNGGGGGTYFSPPPPTKKN